MARNIETTMTRNIVAFASTFMLTQTALAVDGESPLRLGAGVDGGRVSVDSKVPTELDKTGTQYGVRGFLEYQTRWLSLMVGGAQHSVTVTGEDSSRGVVQQMQVNAATAQGGFYLNLGRRLSLGLSTRVHKGPSADYGVYAKKENHTFRDAGPSIRTRLAIFKGFDVAAEASLFKSLENDVRAVDTVVAGLSASIPVKTPNFGRLEFAAKGGPGDSTAGKGGTKAPGAGLVIDTFDPVHFEHSSDELVTGDETRVANMIKILKGTDLRGRRVQVSGYGSRVGSPRVTLMVSLARAEKIASMLVAGGIPEEMIDFSGYGASVLDPAIEPDADGQRRVVVSLTNPAEEKPASMAFDISTLRVPPGLVYRVDELWTVLEIGRSIRKFRAADKSVVIEVPESVTTQRGTYEKVSHAVSILRSFGLKSNQIATKVVPVKSDIQITVTSPDKNLMAALDRAGYRRGRMLIMPVASDKVPSFVARLKEHRKLWTYVEAKSEIRQEMIAADFGKTLVINRTVSDLWPRAVVGFGPLAENHTLVVVHASRSLKHLRTALVDDADKAPVIESAPETVAPVVERKIEKIEKIEKPEPKATPVPAVVKPVPQKVAKPKESPKVKEPKVIKVVPQPVPLDVESHGPPSFDAPDPLAH